jgi:predicted nucleic acid-binding Zn ribbon protein
MSTMLKRTTMLLLLITVLLVALVGGVIKAQAAHTSTLSGRANGHQVAWICPAPPVDC